MTEKLESTDPCECAEEARTFRKQITTPGMTLWCCPYFDMTRNNQKKKLLLMLTVLKYRNLQGMFEKEVLRLSTVRVEELPCVCGLYNHPLDHFFSSSSYILI